MTTTQAMFLSNPSLTFLRSPRMGTSRVPCIFALYSPEMQSGKTTIAEYMINKEYFLRVRFAEPLKQMLRELYSVIGMTADECQDRLEGDLKDKEFTEGPFKGTSTREHMQTLGTEWGRNQISTTLWTDITRVKLEHVLDDNRTCIVVDDLRFPNEYSMLEDLGAVLIKVTRKKEEERGPVEKSGHTSEGALDGYEFHYTVSNDGFIEDLYDVIDKIIEKEAPKKSSNWRSKERQSRKTADDDAAVELAKEALHRKETLKEETPTVETSDPVEAPSVTLKKSTAAKLTKQGLEKNVIAEE